MIRNKRKSERNQLSNHEKCLVTVKDESVEASLLDVSKEGLRVGNLELTVLFVDERISIKTDTEILVGRCRTVAREEGGTFQVGILRESEDYTSQSQSILINSFVQLENQKLVCVPIQFDENTVQICLLNGEQLLVAHNQVVQVLRQQRLEEFCDGLCLEQALLTYNIDSSGNEFEDRSKVLTHEFGPVNKPFELPQG